MSPHRANTGKRKTGYNDQPDDQPMFQQDFHIGTIHVVIDSLGTVHNLTDAPAEALEFMRNVPTVWDETRYIAGAPARSTVIARRSGDVWYVGAINAAEENFTIDVNEIAATLGKENAAAIHTAGGSLVREDGGFRKPLDIAVNDGAVLVLW